MLNYTDSISNASTVSGRVFTSCGGTALPRSGTSSLREPISASDWQLDVPASFYQNPQFVTWVSTAVPQKKLLVNPGSIVHQGYIRLKKTEAGCSGPRARTDRTHVKPVQYFDSLSAEEIYFEADPDDPTSVFLFAHDRSKPTGQYCDIPGVPSTADWSAISEPVQKSKLPKWLLEGGGMNSKN
jgi:hypothetical protein